MVRRLVPGEALERGYSRILSTDFSSVHRRCHNGREQRSWNSPRTYRRAASLSALAINIPGRVLQCIDRPSGFDAIIGNPPWDMVRGDSGIDETRAGKRIEAQQVTQFVRQSGIYQVQGRAHVNLYQLVERALQLVRPGGRIGFVVPSGLVSDAGTAPLRRRLFDRADVDEVTGFDNRLAIFPVHRSVRFVLFTCTADGTSAVRCRFGLTSAEELEGQAPRSSWRVACSRSFRAMTTWECPSSQRRRTSRLSSP